MVDDGAPRHDAAVSAMIVKTVCPSSLDLMKMLTCITPLACEFVITEPTALTAHGHIVLKHRGNHRAKDGDYQVGVGWGLMVGFRGPFSSLTGLRASAGEYIQPTTTQPPTFPTWIYGAVSSGNIEPAALHYFAAPITAADQLTAPGYYRAEVWGCCHGSSIGVDLLPTDSVVELLVEGVAPQNSVTWELRPGLLSSARLAA